MQSSKQTYRPAVLIAVISLLLLNCRVWAPASSLETPVSLPAATAASIQTQQPPLPARPTDAVTPVQGEIPQPGSQSDVPAGEPAGCLSAEARSALATPIEMLAYADSLLELKVPLSERMRPNVWNASTGEFDFTQVGAYAVIVDDVHNEYWIQTMMDALHVAGFITWLRTGPGKSMHILAIPLTPEVLQPDFPWAGYLPAYWQDRFAVPPHDPSIIPALKLPPCGWMTAQGYAPQVYSGWWSASSSAWPNYAWAAGTYLAADTHAANQVARQINWLGDEGVESADTMCGPLSWAIIRDAGAFPPGIGAWSWSGKEFWLAKPLTNGRPWSLFPPDSYTVHHFSQPLSSFNFKEFPLYPGDFLYTYSKKDGFDHMLVVTEVDEEGNVYSVTNLVYVHPEDKTTVEHVVLYNANDPSVGVFRNKWAKDGRNGRTGHDGFDVFRWAWMEKDINGKPAAYTVQVGDTIGLIAERWKTRVDAIAVYNGISVDAPLRIGQMLMIPPNAGFLQPVAVGR